MEALQNAWISKFTKVVSHLIYPLGRPDLEIKASFFHQLTALEQKLLKSGQGAFSSSWDPSLEQDLNLEQDERLLRNTFQNAKQSPPAEYWLDRKLFQESLN